MAQNNSKWLEMAPNGSTSNKPFQKNAKRWQKGAKEFTKSAECGKKHKKNPKKTVGL